MLQMTTVIKTNLLKLGESLLRKTDTSRLIIAGNWNCTLQRVDKCGGLPWKSSNDREAVVNLMDELNLVDIYRNLHPSIKSFTFESKPLNLKSRIDFIHVSRPIATDAKSAEIRPSVAPDHKATFLSFTIRSELRSGPGTWKCNNSLLKDDKFKQLITFFYLQIHEKYSNVNDKQLLRELIKMEIHAKTIKYSKTR